MRPFAMYAPGCQKSWPPLECTDMMNLMLRIRLDEPDRVLALRLGQLRRALERVADAARRRAVVAVEARPDAVVAVQVDAPGVAGAGSACASGQWLVMFWRCDAKL